MSEIWAFLSGLIALVIPGFGAEPRPVYAGYVEADYVYVAPAAGGTIKTVAVTEGEAVAAGQVLFTLGDSQQQAALRAAAARVVAAEANWQNLETGSRVQEINVIRASLNKAEADLALAQSTLERSERLAGSDLVPQAKLDQDRAGAASAQAQVDQLKAQLAVAELPARNAQITAAEANLAVAQADRDRADADLADRVVRSPASGIVDDVFYAAGESIAAGTPGLSIRPDGETVARFYVPETVRSTLSTGEIVAIGCDGCPEGLTARITRVASQPQFTPPVIYSRDERERLVYAVEARIAAGAELLPGQPLSVTVME
jgi:HlyD family secretion protein